MSPTRNVALGDFEAWRRNALLLVAADGLEALKEVEMCEMTFNF